MTTINSQEDFLRALAENPEWKAAVRAQLLDEDLLQLPARFDAFVAEMKEFAARQEQHNADMTRLLAEQKEINAGQKEINQRIALRLDSLDNNVARLIDDTGWLKGYVTREAALRDAAVIAIGMGLEYVRTVSREELYRMALDAAQGGSLSNDLRSFRRADLVIEATDGDTVQYIAVEVSFIGGSHDVSRALRNASFLADFTGRPARAAIASVKNHDSAKYHVDSGAIYWHEIDQEDLRSD